MLWPLVIVSAVNNDDVLSANLLRSPDVLSGAVRVIEERGHASAGEAYGPWLERAVDSPVIAFIHQDVYLPVGWVSRLREAISRLDVDDPNWGVLGVVGVDADCVTVGEVWDNGLQRRVGNRMTCLKRVVAIDEVVIVLRVASGIRFDRKLPSFHLYAADLVQTARSRGMATYVFDGPIVHNSLLVGQLDKSYRAAYRYMKRKWRDRLPIPTCVMPVTRLGWPLARRWMRVAYRHWRRGYHTPKRSDAPDQLAHQLGYAAQYCQSQS